MDLLFAHLSPHPEEFGTLPKPDERLAQGRSQKMPRKSNDLGFLAPETSGAA